MPRTARPPEARIAENWVLDGRTGCHLWTGYVAKDKGYGAIKVGHKLWRVHRLVWTLAYGPISEGVLILHKCDVRSCINIKHLFAGSHADNMADMCKKERQTRGSQRPAAKLTEEDIPIIRQYLREGLTQRAIAKQYSVAMQQISSINTGRTWRHV